MAKSFTRLTRPAIRKLTAGQRITENGIIFERLPSGDGVYLVNIMVDGQRIHRIVGKESDGTTRTQAEEYIEKLRQEAKAGRLNLPKGRKIALGFEAAAQQYLSRLAAENGRDLITKRQRLRDHLCPFFKSTPLARIKSSDIERYKKQRCEEQASVATINRELAVLSHLFTKALEWQWLDQRPAAIRRFKEDNSRITYLTVEQIERLLDAAQQDSNPQVYLFILIGLETAMRRMEILSIRRADIELHKRMIYIPKAKAGARAQPITAHLAEALEQWLETLPPEEVWLFPAHSASGHTVYIEKAFRRVVAAAGLDPKVVVRHTLRHTAITHLVQAGVDLPTVKRISGHKTLQMVERYSHQNGAHLQAAMDKLAEKYRGPT